MKSVLKKGYAKINLHLDITGIMDNGYHSVQTVMQSVSLCDEVKVSLREDGEYIVTSNIAGVPTDKSNLAIKAALAFEKRVGRQIGANISIEKRIPMAAGLAGGSADAAATLLALNELLGEPLTMSELCEVGSSLGADVPFCIVGGSAYAEGKGDMLYLFPPLCDCYIVVACGGEGVSTPAAYGLLDKRYGGFAEGEYSPRGINLLKKAMDSQDLREICESLYNIFETPILEIRPVAREIKKFMLENGAIGAMMSGSGPSVFGIFDDEKKAISVVDAIRQNASLGATAELCRPLV